MSEEEQEEVSKSATNHFSYSGFDSPSHLNVVGFTEVLQTRGLSTSNVALNTNLKSTTMCITYNSRFMSWYNFSFKHIGYWGLGHVHVYLNTKIPEKHAKVIRVGFLIKKLISRNKANTDHGLLLLAITHQLPLGGRQHNEITEVLVCLSQSATQLTLSQRHRCWLLDKDEWGDEKGRQLGYDRAWFYSFSLAFVQRAAGLRLQYEAVRRSLKQ